MADDFKYAPYQDPALKEAREHLKDKPPGQKLPPDEVACVDCPRGLWMWVQKTAAGRKHAMKGFEDEAGWRCECKERSMRATYDDFGGPVEPDCWVYGCGGRIEAIEAEKKRQYLEWLSENEKANCSTDKTIIAR